MPSGLEKKIQGILQSNEIFSMLEVNLLKPLVDLLLDAIKLKFRKISFHR